jgi:uncharacterized protein (DUF433 family)
MSAVADLWEPIVKDPALCGGRPIVRGSRIEVALLAWQFEVEGRSPDEIVDSFPHLTLGQVHAALGYYYDHRSEIEALWRAEDSAVAQALHRIEQAGAAKPLSR